MKYLLFICMLVISHLVNADSLDRMVNEIVKKSNEAIIENNKAISVVSKDGDVKTKITDCKKVINVASGSGAKKQVNIGGNVRTTAKGNIEAVAQCDSVVNVSSGKNTTATVVIGGSGE